MQLAAVWSYRAGNMSTDAQEQGSVRVTDQRAIGSVAGLLVAGLLVAWPCAIIAGLSGFASPRYMLVSAVLLVGAFVLSRRTIDRQSRNGSREATVPRANAFSICRWWSLRVDRPVTSRVTLNAGADR